MASDPVSVDGGDFRPAHEIDGLESLRADERAAGTDPWHHWGSSSSDLDEDTGVLNDFLDQLDHAAPPARSPEAVVSEPSANVRPFPGGLASALSGPARPSVRGRGMEHQLPPVETGAIEPLDASLPPIGEPEAADVEPLEELPDSAAELAAPLDDLPHVEPAEEAPPPATPDEPSDAARAREAEIDDAPAREGQPDDPVSFNEWLEKRGRSAEGQLLEGLGRFDDGLLVPQRQRAERINVVRVGLIVILASMVIGSYTIYVRTAAQSPFPTEDELERKVPGTGGWAVKPVLEQSPAAIREQDEQMKRVAEDRILKNRLVGDMRHFNNDETLEDAFFQDLLNLGLSPREVRVQALALRGGTELGERPVRANLTLDLAGVRAPEGEDQLERLQSSLKLIWLLVGKYSDQGNVSFESVRVKLGEPTPWDHAYEGRKLVAFWNLQIDGDSLF